MTAGSEGPKSKGPLYERNSHLMFVTGPTIVLAGPGKGKHGLPRAHYVSVVCFNRSDD